jgi:hypothetical protein
MAHSENVLHPDGSAVRSGDRFKTRICMTEYGNYFMHLKTPLDVLLVIYDLLESESAFNILRFF